ncbi:MAG: nitrate reductase associated protein [Polyangiales bacterium]
MYKRFAFEGDVHASLECVPLTVRRKLDLAGLKISLVGWQTLTRAERLALCHLPVDEDDEVEVYREVYRSFADRAGVPLKPLPDAGMSTRPWLAAAPPEAVRARVALLGCEVDLDRWPALDEESRYALLKLSDPKKDVWKLRAALGELGMLPGDGVRADA